MGCTAATITIQGLRWLDSDTEVSHGAPSTTGRPFCRLSPSFFFQFSLPMIFWPKVVLNPSLTSVFLLSIYFACDARMVMARVGPNYRGWRSCLGRRCWVLTSQDNISVYK